MKLSASARSQPKNSLIGKAPDGKALERKSLQTIKELLMSSATQSMDADFFIVSEPFARAAHGRFRFPAAGTRQGPLSEAPAAASAGKLLMTLLAACRIGSAPRITSAECVSNTAGTQA
jgi:hypothetical protein